MSLITIGLLHGPSLNEIGQREPHIYGSLTLADIIHKLKNICDTKNTQLIDYQSNSEGDIISILWEWQKTGVQRLIINPGAYTHTSIAIRDAIQGIQIPAVEVHLSNLYARETFRHTSYTAGACHGVISGLGMFGYEAALNYLLQL